MLLGLHINQIHYLADATRAQVPHKATTAGCRRPAHAPIGVHRAPEGYGYCITQVRPSVTWGSQRWFGHLHRLDARPYQAFIELRTFASHVHSSSRAPSKAPRLLHATMGLFSCSCGSKCKTSLTLVSPTSVPRSSTRITRGLHRGGSDGVRNALWRRGYGLCDIPHAFEHLHDNLEGQF